MTAAIWQAAVVLSLMFLNVGAAQAQSVTAAQNPAELKAYGAAVETRDAGKRAQTLETFLAWYPNSVLRIDAYEQLMAAWQVANQPAKADAAAQRLLQIDPDNVRALANRTYVSRTRAASGDLAALAQATSLAERGLVALGRWRKPDQMSDLDFARLKQQAASVFDGALAFAALQGRDYGRATRFYLEAVAAEPASLQDVYQLSIALLESTPPDPRGFWHAARAMALARSAHNEAAVANIENYAKARYRAYHGDDEGWDAVVNRVAVAEVQPPEDFARSISRVMTPAERAVQLVADNEPGNLSFADCESVLIERDASPANRAAAERVWRAIADKQRRGEARLKVPLKVIHATSERLQGAITEQNQTRDVVDLEVALARPLSPLPQLGAKIFVVGLLSDYRLQPFSFVMTGAELAQESMPVAGGPCADPRPLVCTRDYRPACGLRRDESRRTYSNACSACADPEVVSQSAGACP